MYDVSASVEYCGAVELLWCEVWALCVSVLGYGLGLELCIGARVLLTRTGYPAFLCSKDV